MNIGVSDRRRRDVIAAFTWAWLIGTIVGSAVFAFIVFPDTFANRSNRVVTLYFQTISTAGNNTYFPNGPSWRADHLTNASDTQSLYFTKCELLPAGSRQGCDLNTNWQKVRLSDLACDSLAACTLTDFVLEDHDRRTALVDLRMVDGAPPPEFEKEPALSISDPTSWGTRAGLPVFFACVFLSIQLGRALGQFMFSSYGD